MIVPWTGERLSSSKVNFLAALGFLALCGLWSESELGRLVPRAGGALRVSLMLGVTGEGMEALYPVVK